MSGRPSCQGVRSRPVAACKHFAMLARAGDIEQGVLPLDASNTRWILDGEVVLATGNDVACRDLVLVTPRGSMATPLPVGTHRLRVDVAVAPGHVISEEIPIEIAADSDRDGVPDGVEQQQGTPATIVIHGGRPWKIVGARRWSGVSRRMALPAITHRTLGRGRLAAHRLIADRELDRDR